MLNPSLKSRFIEKFNRFSRILAGLVGYKISPLENKKRSKNKSVKKRVFYKNNKKRKKRFLHLCYMLLDEWWINCVSFDGLPSMPSLRSSEVHIEAELSLESIGIIAPCNTLNPEVYLRKTLVICHHEIIQNGRSPFLSCFTEGF